MTRIVPPVWMIVVLFLIAWVIEHWWVWVSCLILVVWWRWL